MTLGKRKSRSKSSFLRKKRAKQPDEDVEVQTEAFKPRRELAQITTFEQYYQMQGFLSDCWGQFVLALRQPLPVTFRVSTMTNNAEATKECMLSGSRLLKPTADCYDNRNRYVPPPSKLAWCNGWQLGCDKAALKYSDDWHLKKIKAWLADYSSLGVLTRQEVVSMIPASLLAPEPHHLMLDMCASPGSKTTQLLEALHRNGETTTAPEGGGAVVANDVDPRRCYMLVRRCAALGFACSRLMVVCHKGQIVPNAALPGGPAEAGKKYAKPELEGRYPAGIYDRIICDVPCSGDGTLRKLPEVWKQWHPDYGIKLHSIQLQIALRGLSLLRVGGIMCYSTCTFNPVEDEAVVSELLIRCGGAVELMDAHGYLPDLKWNPGLSTWKVIDDGLNHYPTFESTQEDHIPAAMRRRYRRSMWPPSSSVRVSGEPLPLHRCLRLLPHVQNTGGFFVAMLKKVAPLPGPSKRTESASTSLHMPNKPEAPAHIPQLPRQGPRGGHGCVLLAAPPPALNAASKANSPEHTAVDPLEPLYLAAPLQTVLEQVREGHPSVFVLAYLDDAFFMGPPTAIALAYGAYMAWRRRQRLDNIQLMKSAANSPEGDADCFTDGMPCAQGELDFLDVLGVAVGKADAVTTEFLKVEVCVPFGPP
ncbi:hypothetical protein CYMTET_34248 [Cymbomonas tetramitiformis]|uniref:SAM-dependent MTase RsmB/NOP-type domain-containing protein n=1 Tax=Cymbomonas tetramitiformis TaxID=36881 RepID=A0AAE0FBA9_9CHLO|nr:hypothetical protein CYMTET_34248 [Cymbomonas tetramitiformis]